MATFGEYFKDLRKKQKLTLRGFCELGNFDPGNISKIERSRMAPPQSEEKLSQFAKILGLKKDSDEWHHFIDFGMMTAGQIPQEFLSDEELLPRMPVLLRTIYAQKLPVDKIEELIKTLRKE